MQALNEIELTEGTDRTVVYLTLLALFILEEGYVEEEQAW